MVENIHIFQKNMNNKGIYPIKITKIIFYSFIRKDDFIFLIYNKYIKDI